MHNIQKRESCPSRKHCCAGWKASAHSKSSVTIECGEQSESEFEENHWSEGEISGSHSRELSDLSNFPTFPSLTPSITMLFKATFTKWVIASFFEVILARPSRHSTTGAFTSGTSGPRRISLILPRGRGEEFGCVNFATLIDIVTETAIVSFRTLPVGFPLPPISKGSLFSLFCSLILDHSACLIISVSGLKILDS